MIRIIKEKNEPRRRAKKAKRNCDKFKTPQEALDAFLVDCHKYEKDCDICPYSSHKMKLCILTWIYATAEDTDEDTDQNNGR